MQARQVAYDFPRSDGSSMLEMSCQKEAVNNGAPSRQWTEAPQVHGSAAPIPGRPQAPDTRPQCLRVRTRQSPGQLGQLACSASNGRSVGHLATSLFRVGVWDGSVPAEPYESHRRGMDPDPPPAGRWCRDLARRPWRAGRGKLDHSLGQVSEAPRVVSQRIVAGDEWSAA